MWPINGHQLRPPASSCMALTHVGAWLAACSPSVSIRSMEAHGHVRTVFCTSRQAWRGTGVPGTAAAAWGRNATSVERSASWSDQLHSPEAQRKAAVQKACRKCAEKEAGRAALAGAHAASSPLYMMSKTSPGPRRRTLKGVDGVRDAERLAVRRDRHTASELCEF